VHFSLLGKEGNLDCEFDAGMDGATISYSDSLATTFLNAPGIVMGLDVFREGEVQAGDYAVEVQIDQLGALLHAVGQRTRGAVVACGDRGVEIFAYWPQ
jgi:hypothetical protein